MMRGVALGRAFKRLGFATLVLSLAPAVGAQPTGTIEGVVADVTGSPLPGVVVTVTGSGVRQEHVTGRNGAYVAAGLAPGDYVVAAALPGFETAEVTVSVGTEGIETVPIQLQISRLIEAVSVVAEEPRPFARNIVAEPMMRQQSNITNITSVTDNPARGVHPGGRRLRF